MAKTPRVGGEIDAVCTRCKMLLGHTILAMVGTKVARVRCNTCQGEHNFHAPGGSSSVTRESRSRAPPAAKAAVTASRQDLDSLLAGKDISKPLRYSAAAELVEGAVVDHPVFGLGVVLTVRGGKADLLFRAGVKTLAQKRGGAAAGPKRLAAAPAAAEDESAPAP